MVKILVKCMKVCMITLLTIVANQQGELVPDRTDVIKKIMQSMNELIDASKIMEGK